MNHEMAPMREATFVIRRVRKMKKMANSRRNIVVSMADISGIARLLQWKK
jgi:hypothetical protein